MLRQLADYAIARHDPALVGRDDRYLAWLEAVCERQAYLIAQWMLVGFIHGVMNTDNAALSGETIDFGPCAFMERYDPQAVFSSIDTGGRYAYANQPSIGRWNLARMAESILLLIDADEDEAIAAATRVIESFESRFEAHWLAGMRAKLGLTGQAEDDDALARDWLLLLETGAADYTQSMRALADAAEGRREALDGLLGAVPGVDNWVARWQERAAADNANAAGRAAWMRRRNPVYLARNHLVEAALDAAWRDDDLAPFERLLAVLARPFEVQPGMDDLAAPAPTAFTAGFRTFCGT